MGLIGKVATKNGKLCVLYESTLFSEPMLSRTWWLIVQTKGNPYGAERPDVGDTARSMGIGDSEWRTHRENPYVDTGSVWTERGEAFANEIVPFPSPKVRAGIEVRWYEGRWEKLMKKGWVPA